VLYFTRDPENEAVVAHRAKGGRAVFVQDEAIWLATGSQEDRLIRLDEVALPTSGHFDFHVEDVLAATAAAWQFGVAENTLMERLRTYSPTI
jgi:cyanophycin synthetase